MKRVVLLLLLISSFCFAADKPKKLSRKQLLQQRCTPQPIGLDPCKTTCISKPVIIKQYVGQYKLVPLTGQKKQQ